jgi:hypothetical protein
MATRLVDARDDDANDTVEVLWDRSEQRCEVQRGKLLSKYLQGLLKPSSSSQQAMAQRGPWETKKQHKPDHGGGDIFFNAKLSTYPAPRALSFHPSTWIHWI